MEELLQAAMAVSLASGGIDTSTRYIRSTQLFTRLTVACYSFVRLLPGNTITRDRVEFWDWPSLACIARNIVEIYHAFYYLADPRLTEDECGMRINLMHFHLNSEKYRLYKEWGADVAVLRSFEEGLPKDQERLRNNKAFQSLTEGKQRDLLKGRAAMHLTHAEIGESLPFMDRHFRPIYRLFSNHVHSSPFSFQAQSNERGRGDENDAERFYITLAIQVVVKYVSAAILDMARIFTEKVGKVCEDRVSFARQLHNA